MLLATTDSGGGLVVVWLLLHPLLVMRRGEGMRLPGVVTKVMLSASSATTIISTTAAATEEGDLHHSRPVKARLTRRALTLEGFEAAARTPLLLSAHLGRAGPLVCGLHVSFHRGG